MKKTLFSVTAALAVALSGCGGGGTSSDAGGTSSGLYSNSVSIDSKNLTAGVSTPITARAIMRGTTPTSMKWTVTPLGSVNPSDPVPVVADVNCTSATFAPPAVAGASGEGACRTVLTVPVKAASGKWRITNTAASETASVSNFADITVTGRTINNGFRLVESSVALTGYVGQPVNMSSLLSANPGQTISNVVYTWTADALNPTVSAIAGKNSSTASFTPSAEGQYAFALKVTADVNGVPEEASTTVVVNVTRQNFADIIDAGLPQLKSPGEVTTLIGALLNRDDELSYSFAWRQLPGAEGGPQRVSLSNANSMIASFVAPSTEGTYGFEFETTKRQRDGTNAITTSRTAVVVSADAAPIFSVSASPAQIGTLGTSMVISGTVNSSAASSNVNYSYAWTQLSGPAVTLSNSTTDMASFIPSVTGDYVFRLTVTAVTASGTSSVSSDTQTRIVSNSAASNNIAFTANAGPIQAVATNSIVTLRGDSFIEGNAGVGTTFAFAWSQLGGTPAAVTLSNTNSATPTFFASAPGTYTFQLTATVTLPDGNIRTALATTQVIAGGVGSGFSVSAGDAQAIAVNTAALLDGSIASQGSVAGTTFTYQWTQIGATPAAVVVSNANSIAASFVPTVPGTYTFQLTVTANDGGVITTRSSTTQVLATP